MTRNQFLRLLALPAAGGVAARLWPGQISPQSSLLLPPIRAEFSRSHCRTEGDTLIVSTGLIERKWRCTGKGLVTISLRDLARGREWCAPIRTLACDWAYPGIIDDESEARFVSLTAVENDDESFTSPHLRVVTEVKYPAQGISVRYVIWAYPDAPGLRSQVWIQGNPQKLQSPSDGRVDYLPLNWETLRPARRFAGCYNDTQHRDTAGTPLLREEVEPPSAAHLPAVDWASIAGFEVEGAGVLSVKESHKCVNRPGVNTGAFAFDSSGFHNTGWGLAPEDFLPTKFQWCWASWIVVSDATDDGRELALKQFDRLRYPTKVSRDMWTLACTWGSSTSWVDGQMAAREKEVLLEMDSVADLGIDLLQIDSGWQVGPAGDLNHPIPTHGWRPDSQSYPGGWHAVAARRDQLGIRLGLWAVAEAIPLEDLEWNWEQLRLTQFKLDFAKLNSYGAIVKLIEKVRQFELFTRHQCIVGWDTTENAPRFGYYWAREYGDLHFMNRKPKVPPNAVYIPWLALRDFWHLARYNNLNKWQLVTQNPETVDPTLSDAVQHSAAYCSATTLMGIPEFMTLTRNYSPTARSQIRALLKIYKQSQKEIFESFVFAVGDEPSNRSWTGFQSYHPDSNEGFLLIFRERLSLEECKRIHLRFVPSGSAINLQDLETGDKRRVTLGQDGSASFTITRPADFLFLRYSKESS